MTPPQTPKPLTEKEPQQTIRKTKYLVLMETKDIMAQYDSLMEAIDVAYPGQSIYKCARIGKVDKDGKYQPIKRKKK